MRTPAGGPALAVGLAGVGLALAFEPVAAPYIAPVAVAVLVLVTSGRRVLAAAALGWVFGVGFMAVLLWWLAPSVGGAAWVALSLVEATWFALVAVGVRVVRRLPGWPVWAAGVWTSVELLRQQWPFGGFPWGRLGHAVVDTPWSDLLPYLGTTGTGFVLALLGTCGAWACDTVARGRRRGLVAVALLAALGAASLAPALVTFRSVPDGELTVAVVQGGVPGRGNQVAANAEAVTANHAAATVDLAADVRTGRVPRPDLVVWPENATASDPFRDAQVATRVEQAVTALAGVPLLVGALVDAERPENVLNQGIVWSLDGPTDQRYTKHHPVPFGEYIPFRSVLGGLSGRLDQVPRDMLPGTGSTPLQVGGVRLGNAICFDIAYDDVVLPQVRRGAELVVVQTSNAMFIGTDQLDQQFAISRARAIETGRSVVVASINGVSGIIRGDGSIQRRSPTYVGDVLVDEVQLSTTLTPAVRLGRLPALVVWWVTAAAVVGAVVARVRDRRGHVRDAAIIGV